MTPITEASKTNTRSLRSKVSNRKSSLKIASSRCPTPVEQEEENNDEVFSSEEPRRTRSRVPSCLPTPSDTAPPTPPPLGPKHVQCQVCNKILMEKSLARHLATVHKIKCSSENTVCQTPIRRSSRKRSSPHLITEHESQPRRARVRSSASVSSVDLDSPAKNIRMSSCPLCGQEMAKSLIPKHFQVSFNSHQII